MKSFRDYLWLSNSCSYDVDDVIGRADRFEFQNFCSPACNKWAKWSGLSVDINICPQGVVCSCPGAIYMYKSIKIYTRTRCQVSVYRNIGPLVHFSFTNFQTLKLFVTHFSGTVRPRRLKLGTHVDNVGMYTENHAAALICPFIFFIFLSPIFKH